MTNLEKLKAIRIPLNANDSIAEFISKSDLQEIKLDVCYAVQNLLDALCIDTIQDHNTRETAKRVSKMLIDETLKGRYHPMPEVTAFPNFKNLDEFFVAGPIDVKSLCSHHFQPIIGKAWVGIKPGSKVIGLSKYHRLVDWICRRPQIQEEMTVMIADEIEKIAETPDVAVIVKAEHFCCKVRGIEQDSMFTTSVMRGIFKESHPS